MQTAIWRDASPDGAFQVVENDYFRHVHCWLQVPASPVLSNAGMVISLDGLSQFTVVSEAAEPDVAVATLLWRSARTAAFLPPPSGDVLLRLDQVMPIGGNVRVKVESTGAFLARDACDMAIRTSLMALLLAMSVGGVLFSMALRDRTVLWYAGLTASTDLTWALLMGLAVVPLGIATRAPYLTQVLLLFSYGASFVCGLSFARRFNRVGVVAPRLDRLFAGLSWVIAGYALLGFIPALTPWVFNYFDLLAVVGLLGLLWPGVVSIWAGDRRTGLLYLAGWLPIVLAWVGRLLLFIDQMPHYPAIVVSADRLLKHLGLLPGWLASPHVRQTALFIQAIIFSLALADQASRMRRRRERNVVTDKVTGLPNRTGFMVRAANEFVRDAVRPRTLFLLDIDRFATINETLGYEVGDVVLRETGRRLLRKLADSAVVARVGANQFALLLEEQVGEGALRLLAGGLARQPVEVDGNRLDVSLCGGSATYPYDGKDIDDLMRCAEIALTAAKREKQATVAYHSGLERDRRFQLSLLSALRTAVIDKQLQMFVQPKVSLADGRVCGVEALLRWRHPTLGLVSPSEFLPFAEQTGHIVELTRWAIEESLGVACAWQRAGLGLRMSINLSAIDLAQTTLPAFVAEYLRHSGADPKLICLELTESELMRDPRLAIDSMKALRTLGFQLSLDDFGTGNSALSYLQEIPVNEVKIDRSFILNTRRGVRGVQLLHSISAMCHALGLRVIVEGVETEDDWRHAQEAGCDEVQGYYVAPPMPVSEFLVWLNHNQPFVTVELAERGR